MTLQIPRAITSIRQLDRQLDRLSRWIGEPEVAMTPRRSRQLRRLSKVVAVYERSKYTFYKPTVWEMMEFRLEQMSGVIDAETARAYINGEIDDEQMYARQLPPERWTTIPLDRAISELDDAHRAAMEQATYPEATPEELTRLRIEYQNSDLRKTIMDSEE